MIVTRNAPKPASTSTVELANGRTVLAHFEHEGLKNAPWDEDGADGTDSRHYTASFSLDGGNEFISFDFWDSMEAEHRGMEPDPKKVIRMIASDAQFPTDPDEVFAEIEGTPSTCARIAQFSKELQDWLEAAGTNAEEIGEAVTA